MRQGLLKKLTNPERKTESAHNPLLPCSRMCFLTASTISTANSTRKIGTDTQDSTTDHHSQAVYWASTSTRSLGFGLGPSPGLSRFWSATLFSICVLTCL